MFNFLSKEQKEVKMRLKSRNTDASNDAWLASAGAWNSSCERFDEVGPSNKVRWPKAGVKLKEEVDI